jgi:hypothetical protein
MLEASADCQRPTADAVNPADVQCFAMRAFQVHAGMRCQINLVDDKKAGTNDA